MVDYINAFEWPLVRRAINGDETMTFEPLIIFFDLCISIFRENKNPLLIAVNNFIPSVVYIVNRAVDSAGMLLKSLIKISVHSVVIKILLLHIANSG